MRDQTPTLLSWVRQALGVPLGAIPLSCCRIIRPYLLAQRGMGDTGTAFIFAVPYVMAEDALSPLRNLSVYAVPEDYHHYFSRLEQHLLPMLTSQYHQAKFALFADHSPIDEVTAAATCGLGMVGDHGLLITPDYGSFVFLGELITDMSWEEVSGESAFQPMKPLPRCEGCGACVAACPGGCLPDSRKTCVSAISQKKGDLTTEEEALLLSQPLSWGCDTCQMVCPHNQRILKEGRSTPVDYFQKNRISALDTSALHRMSEEEFRRRAYAWRGRFVIERNLTLREERSGYAQTHTGETEKR